jgi:integrase
MDLRTGTRKSEVLQSTWDQFDLNAGVWVKPSSHTKQRKTHRVPLSSPALQLLLRRLQYRTVDTYSTALIRFDPSLT